MRIADFVLPGNAIVDVRASDKSRLLTELCNRAGDSLKLNADMISASILKREQLGSTGVGGGVAIPHARLQEVKEPFGVLVRLQKAIDFSAIDGAPVDLVFLLLLPASPAGEHLAALAAVARKLRDPDTLRELRQAADNAGLYHVMISGSE